MIPEHFYITSLGVMAYGFIYVPTILAVAVLLWRLLRVSWKVNAPITLLLLTLPFWDVYMIGRDADRLCNSEAGLHVYKMVEADSFRGGGNILKLSRHGFTYAEAIGLAGKIYRREVVDGELRRYVVDDFTTQYSVGDRGYQVISKSIASNARQVVDLESGEILGELTTLNIYPGLFDGILLKIVGSGPVIWHCGEEAPVGKAQEMGYDDLIVATLKPRERDGSLQ